MPCWPPWTPAASKPPPTLSSSPGRLWFPEDAYFRSRVRSKGRYGRTRAVTIDASENVVDKLYAAVQVNFDLAR